MKTLPYRFLPILLLLLLPILLTTGRDLGPMSRYPLPHKAITASSSKVVSEESSAPGPLDPKPGTKARVINALLPFSTIAVVTFAGMLLDGFSKLKARGDNSALTLVGILSESDSINALIWSSAAGWLVAMGLMLGQGVLSLSEAMDAWMEGMKEVLEPAFVLLLAWALGDVIGRLKAADWLARSLHSGLPRWVLPPLISILAHLISYACGSSFGTMGIILPLVGPLALKLGKGDPQYLSHCIGSVLGGAVFGNICSPISDTTILTVLATRCDLQAHVASITPYTLLAAVTALVFGSAPVALGCYGPFTALIISAAAMTLTVRFAGRKPPEQ